MMKVVQWILAHLDVQVPYFCSLAPLNTSSFPVYNLIHSHSFIPSYKLLLANMVTRMVHCVGSLLHIHFIYTLPCRRLLGRQVLWSLGMRHKNFTGRGLASSYMYPEMLWRKELVTVPYRWRRFYLTTTLNYPRTPNLLVQFTTSVWHLQML